MRLPFLFFRYPDSAVSSLLLNFPLAINRIVAGYFWEKMRKIRGSQIFIFSIFVIVIVICGIVTTRELIGRIPLGDFRGIVLTVVALILIYLYGFIIYRLFLCVLPLKEGDIAEHSREEFVFHLYLLFYLILFRPLIESGLLPLPLMRLVYIALGARLGNNTYTSGFLLDPPLTRIGANTIIGQHALLIAHVIEGKRLAQHRIIIGNNVTVGAHAVIMAGVTIEDNAIIGVGAVVPKGSHVSAGEVWGGVPAKKLKDSKKSDVQS
jgi:acetyltransferase-like isoleucine patch superfamily enzyme